MLAHQTYSLPLHLDWIPAYAGMTSFFIFVVVVSAGMTESGIIAPVISPA